MKNRKYQVNDNAFSEITKESCYWAGFIAADGYIWHRKNGNTKQLQIGLNEKDKEQLQSFKSWIGFTGPIKLEEFETNYGLSVQVKLAITSSKIVDDLKKNFNIEQRKSFSLQPPILLKNDFILAYIKGYTDGNGTINYREKVKGKNKLYWELCSGSKDLLIWIKLFIDQNYRKNQNRNINIQKDKSAFRLTCGGERAKKLLKDLNNICFYGINRKWDIARIYIK